MTDVPRRLIGSIQVGLPPDEAFRLFTPRGEQDWVTGWEPRFPAPAPDDTKPGTQCPRPYHHLARPRPQWGKRVSYARVTPGDRAGTVTIVVYPTGRHSEVEVTYELTALTRAASHRLRAFADNYHACLQSWQGAIRARLRG